MNWGTFSAVLGAVTAAAALVVALLRGLFVWGLAVRDNTRATDELAGQLGTLSQQTEQRLDRHGQRLDDHGRRLDDHQRRLDELLPLRQGRAGR